MNARIMITAGVAALVVNSIAVTSSFAQQRSDYGYYVGGQIAHAEMDAGHRHESGNEILRGPIFGGQFGIQPFSNEHWELRFRLEQGELDVDNSDAEESATWYALDTLYLFNDRFNYVFAGPHYQDFDNGSQPGAHLGLGARYHFADNWALTGEVQGLYGIDESTTDFTASVGLLYFFGDQGAAKVVEADNDQDGVVNSRDKCMNTPLGHSVDADGCTRFIEQAIIKQVTILFAHDDATIAARSYGDVREIADFMKQHPQLSIIIEGHTSLVGSKAYNQKLSEQRAQAVQRLLVERYQVEASRIEAFGFGETRPAVTPEQTEDDAALNRRIMVEMNASQKVAAKVESH